MIDILSLALEVSGLGGLVVMIFLIANSPAIITMILGLAWLKKKPKRAKYLLIFSGIYFIVGLGICGSMLS